MWELDCEESWVLKNWCFWTVVLEKTLESPLDFKEIQPVYPTGNQSWIFFGRTDAEDEYFGHLMWRTDLFEDPDAGKDGRQEEKKMTEDEMVGWHHQLDGHEFEQAAGVDYGQESLAYSSPWGCKESDTNEWLNWTEIQDKSFPGGSVVKNLPANTEDVSSIPGMGRYPGEGSQLIPVFLPGKSQGQRSLVGYSQWGYKRVRHDLGLNNNNKDKTRSYSH